METTTTKRPRVILADDHALVAEALAEYLAETCEMIAVVNDGFQLVEACKRHRPEVVISDMSMPGLSGIEAMCRLKAEGVEAKFIFLTMHADRELAGEALRLGASAYVLKSSAGEELRRAVAEVIRGGVYITPLIARDALEAISNPRKQRAEALLTLRQREVLRLLARGRSMKEIAVALELSSRTIETHKYRMMQVLGIQSTAELIEFALDHGFIERRTSSSTAGPNQSLSARYRE